MGEKPYFLTWQSQESDHSFEITKGVGSYFILSNGRKVLDLSSTSFHTAFGYSNSEINNAIVKQAQSFAVASPKSTFALKHDVSVALQNYLKLKRGKLFYTVSGAETVENALKMARYNKKANIVLSRNKSYHGASLGALSITGDWRIQGHATVKEWTVRIPEPEEDPDLSKTRKIILETGPENIAAFCLETITGGNGVIIPPKSWWKGIQSLCDEFGIYLILDEIVCGFGRTGKNFGFHHFNLRPDFVCMAKAITGGHIPFGALWVTGKIAEHFNSETFSFGLTNYGHPLGLAAAKKVLQILSREKTKKHLLSLEKIISSYAKDFKSLSNVNEVRLTGALCAIELKSKIDLFHTLIEKGIYVSQIGQNLILCPSYITTEKQLKSGIETLFNIIKEISHDENILKCQRGA